MCVLCTIRISLVLNLSRESTSYLFKVQLYCRRYENLEVPIHVFNKQSNYNLQHKYDHILNTFIYLLPLKLRWFLLSVEHFYNIQSIFCCNLNSVLLITDYQSSNNIIFISIMAAVL